MSCPPHAPLQAIEKRFQSIAVAMQRAERAAAAGGDKGGRGGKADEARAEPPRRSGRQTQQVGGTRGGLAAGCSPQSFFAGPLALFHALRGFGPPINCAPHRDTKERQPLCCACTPA